MCCQAQVCAYVCVCLTVSVHCVCTQAEFVYVCECEGVGGGGSHPCRTAVPVTIWGWETEEGPGLTLLGTPKQTHLPARSICSLDTQRPSRTLAGCKQTGKFKAKPGHHVLWGIFWPSCAHTSTYSCPSPETQELHSRMPQCPPRVPLVSLGYPQHWSPHLRAAGRPRRVWPSGPESHPTSSSAWSRPGSRKTWSRLCSCTRTSRP